MKTDTRVASCNVRPFAQAQCITISDCEIEILPGLMAGRTTAKVAGIPQIAAWQQVTRTASRELALLTARISGIARPADARLAKCFPTEVFDVGTVHNVR